MRYITKENGTLGISTPAVFTADRTINLSLSSHHIFGSLANDNDILREYLMNGKAEGVNYSIVVYVRQLIIRANTMLEKVE